MESKGGGSGGELWRGRQWCRVVEGGSSPRLCPCPLIVSHVCLLFPMSAHCCLCPHIVSCVCALLSVSTCCCLCPCIVACVCMLLPTFIHISSVVFVCKQSSLLVGMGGTLHSWVVVFVQGWSTVVHGWSVFIHGQRHNVMVVGKCHSSPPVSLSSKGKMMGFGSHWEDIVHDEPTMQMPFWSSG